MFQHLIQASLLILLALPLEPAQAATRSVSGRVAGPDGTAISGAVVFVQTSAPAGARPGTMAVVDQVNKTFVPGVLPIVVGTTVRFPNHDQIRHHVYSFSPTKTFELPLYKGEDAPPVLFDKVGIVKIACNIHDWMSGIILVLPSPHFAVTDADGKFVLEDMPNGTYTLVAWHALSKLKPEQTAQTVQLPGTVNSVNFTLTLAAARARPAIACTGP
jgi:plastocyanin